MQLSLTLLNGFTNLRDWKADHDTSWDADDPEDTHAF